jgi:hypothetical protein
MKFRPNRTLFALIAAVLVIAAVTGGVNTATGQEGCDVTPSVTFEEDGSMTATDRCGTTITVAPGEKVSVCHVSPGNLKERVNVIGQSAVIDHLTLHSGDKLVSCALPEVPPTPVG